MASLEAQNAKFMQFAERLKHALVSRGVSCCGGDMTHSNPEDHSAVDTWDHTLEGWLRELV
ncbi:MAG: DUF294 nucleotidyltransferase-like domain-containing protein [Rhizobium sp.]|nr:DUF294 nucleotidyltransferase-like domain-containing protein [Rhizobium sp.]